VIKGDKKMVVKNPENKVFSASHTLQSCDSCGYWGYAETFKDPLFSKCPKCEGQEVTVR